MPLAGLFFLLLSMMHPAGAATATSTVKAEAAPSDETPELEPMAVAVTEGSQCNEVLKQGIYDHMRENALESQYSKFMQQVSSFRTSYTYDEYKKDLAKLETAYDQAAYARMSQTNDATSAAAGGGGMGWSAHVSGTVSKSVYNDQQQESVNAFTSRQAFNTFIKAVKSYQDSFSSGTLTEDQLRNTREIVTESVNPTVIKAWEACVTMQRDKQILVEYMVQSGAVSSVSFYPQNSRTAKITSIELTPFDAKATCTLARSNAKAIIWTFGRKPVLARVAEWTSVRCSLKAREKRDVYVTISTSFSKPFGLSLYPAAPVTSAKRLVGALTNRVNELTSELSAAREQVELFKAGGLQLNKILLPNGWSIDTANPATDPNGNKFLSARHNGVKKFEVLSDGNIWCPRTGYLTNPTMDSLEFFNGWKIGGPSGDLQFHLGAPSPDRSPGNSAYTKQLSVFGDGNLWMRRLAARFPNHLGVLTFPNKEVSGMVC